MVAWGQELADANDTHENVSVRVAAPGGDFGQAQTFSATSERPLLAAGADGTVALTWLVGSTRTVHVARLAPGQTSFVEATPLTVGGGETPTNLHVAVSGGDIFLSFDSTLNNASSVWAATLRAGTGAVALLPGPATASALDHQAFAAGQPSITVDESTLAAAAGQVFVTWQQQNEGAPGVQRTTTVKLDSLAPNGQFGAPAPIDTQQSSSLPFTEPQVAAGGGHVYVVWLRVTRDRPAPAFKDVTTGSPRRRSRPTAGSRTSRRPRLLRRADCRRPRHAAGNTNPPSRRRSSRPAPRPGRPCG